VSNGDQTKSPCCTLAQTKARNHWTDATCTATI